MTCREVNSAGELVAVASWVVVEAALWVQMGE
jgi:hypothetical protein